MSTLPAGSTNTNQTNTMNFKKLIKVSNRGHWDIGNSRMVPVILVAPTITPAFTFGGDKRQRGRAIRKAARIEMAATR